MQIKSLLIILSLFITSISNGQEETENQETKSLKQKLEHFSNVADTLFRKGKTPGAAIAIIYNNKLVCKETFGYRDLENKLPVTNQTLFDIASLTKAFTGVITSQLVHENKLNWNDKVIKHLPEFSLADSYAGKNATIKDLLTHRVGLEQHFYLIYGPKYTRSEVLEKIRYLNFKGSFRENFLYNNFMYTVAGIIQERVTQKSWEELMGQRIFKKLGMVSSFVDMEGLNAYKNKTVSYQNDGKTIIPVFLSEAYAPSGNTASSTIDDMAIWIKMLANSGTINGSEFLSKKQFDYLTSPFTVRYPDLDIFYGIGWNIDKQRDAIYHRGSSPGQNSTILYQPKKGFAIVILTNQSSLVANVLEIYASNIFLHDNFERIMEHENYIESRANQNKKAAEIYTIDDTAILKQLKNFAGKYNHPAYGTIEIETIEKNMFSFTYYAFKGTIKHNEDLNFSAYVNFLQGPDKFNFRILKDKKDEIKGIELSFPYAEPLLFERVY